MTKKLQGRVATVTGAGLGFGEGITRHFAEPGAKLVRPVHPAGAGELKAPE